MEVEKIGIISQNEGEILATSGKKPRKFCGASQKHKIFGNLLDKIVECQKRNCSYAKKKLNFQS